MEVSGQLHAPAALTPGNNSRNKFDRRLGGTQSWSERGDVDKKSQSLVKGKVKIKLSLCRKILQCFQPINYNNLSPWRGWNG